ncbi:hypothetical protein EYV94_13415 [Puteibacter caeruleilacunae]|nr:hypothetical protein EYV94_13415 [Puteibacter caeruleilacunae]
MKLSIIKGASVLTFIIIYTSFSAKGQMNRELVHVDYTNIGSGNEGGIAFEKSAVGFTLPTMLKKKGNVLFNTFEYANTRVDYGISNELTKYVNDFHMISYSVGYRKALKNKWGLTAMFTPRISSNFDSSLEWSDLRLMGLVMFSKPVRSNLFLNLGVMYSATMGNNGLLPVFSMRWLPAPKWTVNVGFPRFGLEYEMNKNTQIGANLVLMGENFSLTDEISNDDITVDNIRMMNVGGGLTLKQKLTKMINLKLAAGYTFYRIYDLQYGTDKVDSFSLDDNFYLKVGISIGI